MSGEETVTLGRAKRATAGNRMRELLEKAHQQDDDELFAEEEGDEEFEAPQEARDVFLDEFADTDDEIQVDEEEEERRLRREERRKAKGKSKAIYNPMGPVKVKKVQFPADPSSSTPSSPANVSLLDPSIDPNTMAPSTLVLALRKQRREQKRLNRSQTLRSTLRASTLRTETDILEKEQHEKLNPNRKGRRAQHETGEIRVVRRMTQAELIAEALEEEERNKEALRDWVRREEEKRELRRVGRKRVRGPRWTWISRTVGKLVEEIEEVGRGTPAAGQQVTTAAPNSTEAATQPAADPDTVTPGQASIGEVQSLPETPNPPSADAATQPTVPNEPTPTAVADTPALEAPAVALPDTDGITPVPPLASNLPRDTPTNAAAPLQTTQSQSLQDDAESAVPALADVQPLLPQESALTPVTDAAVPETPTAARSQNVDNTPVPPPASSTPSDIPIPPVPTNAEAGPSTHPAQAATPQASQSELPNTQPESASIQPDTNTDANTQYTRNYIILSQVPGGLAAELKLILGDHVEWDEVRYIPHRNRPINRRPTICPFTGLPAKYRHPGTMTPYASIEGYRQIEALLKYRYMWNTEASAWYGGEEDVSAEGTEDLVGWAEAIHGGWMGGKEFAIESPQEVQEGNEDVAMEEAPRKGKRRAGDIGDEALGQPVSKKSKGGKSSKKKAKG